MNQAQFYDEESELLTDEEMAIHKARLFAMRNGTYDIKSCLVEAPEVVRAFVIER